MAEYWVHPETGNDANPGTELAPWKTIPGITGANTVIAGDIINVRNGTITKLVGTSRLIPVTNTLYRGYELASNKLNLSLPEEYNPSKLISVECVREPGVHEGLWIIDATQSTISGALFTGTRSNITVEDLELWGPTTGSFHAVEFGNTSAPGTNITLRRVYINGATKAGVHSYSNNTTLDKIKITNTGEDSILLKAGTYNSYQAGSTVNIINADLSHPNFNLSTKSETGALGDLIQLFTDTVQWDGTVNIIRVAGIKTGSGKQAIVLPGGAGTFNIKTLHLDGGGNCQIMIGHMLGTVNVRNFYVGEWLKGASTNQLFRFDAKDSGAPSYGWGTGSTITIKNGIVFGGNSSGLISLAWPFSSGPFEHNGAVEVKNVTVVDAVNGSWLRSNIPPLGEIASTLAFDSPRVTYGAAFNFTATNNCFNTLGRPQIRLPAGTAGDARFQFQNNFFASTDYYIGTTNYADLVEFELAHSFATNNISGTPNLTSVGAPNYNSSLIGAGLHSSYSLDISSKAFYNPPSIGAYEFERARAIRS